MQHNNWSVYDLVMDDSFKNSVKNPQSKEGLYWEEFFWANPDKRTVINEARLIILQLDFETDFLSKNEVHDLWEKLEHRIEKKDVSTFSIPLKSHISSLYKIAAIFIGLLVVSISVVMIMNINRSGTQKYTTGYGEIRTVFLPDSTKVILNANSILTHSLAWDNDQPREISLSGEAYFNVVHTTNHQRFIVNASDLAVEVLGTEFNVKDRGRGTKVVLSSGKVKLDLNDPQRGREPGKRTIYMKPGEYVKYSKSDHSLIVKEVDLYNYVAWKENLLVFDDTPIKEIAKTLEDNYGLEITLEDDALANREFTATYPADNINIILEALSKSFDIEISRDENKVVFEDNN